MPKPKILVLTGAGISAESGLKTFRDSDGLWENYRIEEVATPDAWRKQPQLVLDFYNARRVACLAAQPNAAHLGLVQLEADYDVCIVTQNIDDLHERAGSSRVIHLHGSITKVRSERNEALLYDYDMSIVVGDLAQDGAQLRPHIVWFGEAVPNIEQAYQLVENWAEIIVLIGSSLQVYPAAGLLAYAPSHIPKYILDKNIPATKGLVNIYPIALPATQAVAVLKECLASLLS
jgi:NAD-dependent deacetylase